MTQPGSTAGAISMTSLFGCAPQHWKMKPLKRCVRFVEGPGILAVEFTNAGVPLLRIRSIGGRTATLDGCDFLHRDQVETRWSQFRVQDGDLLISGSASTGLCAEVDEATTGAIPYTGIIIVRPSDNQIDRDFFRWFFLSDQFAVQVALAQTGSAIQHFGPTHLSTMFVSVPPLSTQQAIAKYLDRETNRLDALVAAKERVLELLAEKRRALITRAVTRGLDPCRPLRDSGIPWLGKIPAHWAITQLKFASSSLQTGPFGSQLHAEDYVTGGTPVVNPSHLNAGRIHADDRVSVDQATAERLAIHRLCLSDIVFARRGEMGRCGIVERSNVGWLCGTGSLRARLRKDTADPYYVSLVFGETGIADVLTFESVGSTMDNLNTEILGSCQVPIPPLVEQRAIVAHIAAETATLDSMRSATERTIDLLKERRAALIAAAVTGQIDVGSGRYYTDDAARQKEPERRQ